MLTKDCYDKNKVQRPWIDESLELVQLTIELAEFSTAD